MGTAAADRFTADAVTRAPDALPVTEILRGVSGPSRSCCAWSSWSRRPTTPCSTAWGGPLPTQVARELYRAGRDRPRSRRHGVRPAFSLATILDGLDEESRALGQALISRPGPDPRSLGQKPLAYEIERLVLELEDSEWQDRSAWNRDAMSEAERDGEADLVDRLTLERRMLNEQRNSLDKRRDQTRLLGRAPAPAAR